MHLALSVEKRIFAYVQAHRVLHEKLRLVLRNSFIEGLEHVLNLLVMSRFIAQIFKPLKKLFKSMLPFPSLSVSEFEAFLQSTPDVQLIDVRTPLEYAEGHLPGSTNMDVMAPDFLPRAQTQLDANRPVAVYCRSGARSKQAAMFLARLKLQVTDLDSGFLGWAASGREVEKNA